MANLRTLAYDLTVPDTGKSRRKHRASEVMAIVEKINDGVYISATEPDAGDRYQGMIWVETGADYTHVWICDHNLQFTIQLG